MDRRATERLVLAHHVRRRASAFWGAPVMEVGVMPIRRSGAETAMIVSNGIEADAGQRGMRCSARPR